MNAKFIEKLVGYMLILFLLVYVGVQVTRTFGDTVTTQTAQLATVFQSVEGRALVFREEIVLQESGTNVVRCLFDDAQRVLVGQPVVEFMPPGTYVDNRSRLRETQREIDMLEQAQNASLNHVFNAEVLGREIQQQLGLLTAMSSTGGYSGALDVRYDLASLLNMRQIAIGREQDFKERISELTIERDRLIADTARRSDDVVNAPVSGFYARSVDGLEGILYLDVARNAGIEQLKPLIENTRPRQTAARAGRIVTSHNWYTGVIVSQYKTQWIRPGQRLNVVFETTGTRVPATVTRILSQHAQDYAVLVLHSNHVSDETINLRVSNVRLDFRMHEGIRVDAQALRFVDGERGVFILHNNVVLFRRLYPIYEEPGFLLSRHPNDPRDTVTLRKHEQIIIGGVDLEHGRVLN